MLTIKRHCSQFNTINQIINTRKAGDKTSLRGWIQNIRRLKNKIFFDVNDGSTHRRFQVVVPSTEGTKKITIGNSISTTGRIKLAPNGQFEMLADDVKEIGGCGVLNGYPFQAKTHHPPEYVREYLHLRSRVDYIAAIMRLRHRAQQIIHDYMDNAGFIQINTPILTVNDCEGAGEVFTAQPHSTILLKDMSRSDVPFEQSFFDSKVFLTVSGQFHLEAMSYGLGNTYTFSPAFRAENSKSPLHLSEFYMFEAEIAFIEDITELAHFIEKYLKEITLKLLDSSAAEDIELCNRKSKGRNANYSWLQTPWSIIDYDEAAKIIHNNAQKFKTKFKSLESFSKEQEIFLVDHLQTPVFVINWPSADKPFYMKSVRNKPNYVHALDLLVPNVGELCGGSLRECDWKRLSQHPQLPSGLDWYLDLRKLGGIPTGGFGMGFERFLLFLSGVKNIRDVIPFPRYPHSCKM